MPFDHLAPGSTVLVTGATGFIGSATTDLLAQLGYKVKAVTRDVTKAKAFKESLDKKYGADAVDFVAVPDFLADGAFDEVLKGVDGLIHVATDFSFNPDFDVVVTGTINATTSIFRAAAKVPSIKSAVLTSSCASAYYPEVGKGRFIKNDEFADFLVDMARNTDSSNPMASMVVYSASKVAGERAAWKAIEETKPSFTFNAILPHLVIGPVLNPTPGQYSSHSWINQFFNNDQNSAFFQGFKAPTYNAVDVRDVAAIHVAALLSGVNGKRLWAGHHPVSGNKLLATWRKAFPDRSLPADFEYDAEKDTVYTIDDSESEELLKGLLGRSWISFEETAVANVQDAL